MAKRRYGTTERKIARFHKEGRGRGGLSGYRPWLTIQDVPSIGLASRIPGFKTKRLHHLLSSNERNVFLECDWDARVTDIREQFPLDRAETVLIAEAMGVRHPSDRGVDTVMTTDFLVDHVAGDIHKRTAISVKLAKDLEDDRNVEKLEIERRYWKARGIPYRVLTEKETSETRATNIRFFGERAMISEDEGFDEVYWNGVCDGVVDAIARARAGSLLDALSTAERANGWRRGDALAAVRHLLAIRRLTVDLEVAFDARMPATNVRVTCTDRGQAAR